MARRSLITLTLIVPALVACSSATNNNTTDNTTADNTITVATSLYPIAEIVQRVGGDLVDVVNLTPPGTDAHDVELTAKQAQRLEESGLVFYFGENFQPSIEKAIDSLSGVTRIDLFDSVTLLKASIGKADDHSHGDGHNHSDDEYDPHVWLDPSNMIAMTKTVESTLAKIQPDNAATFSTNGAEYIEELTALGEFLDSTIGIPSGELKSRCQEKNIYTAHQGFRYLAERAGLLLTPVAGINPDEQVSTKYLESLSESLKGKDITIFYESLISSSATEALATSLKVRTDVLNPLEGMSQEDIDNGVTYLSAQRDNIQRIAQGLRCS
jgi:zinc transport system substrate-binding protein